MNRFYFHLVTPSGYLPDDSGVLFESVEDAYLAAYEAALELSLDAVRTHKRPYGHRFEILDEQANMVLNLPFSELLAGPAARPKASLSDLHQTLSAQVSRSRELREEIASGLEQARRTLETTRSLLERNSSPAF